MRTRAFLRCAAFVLISASSASLAQEYPTKPIRVITGFAPGGGTDVFARIIAGEMTKALGQQAVVENRVGANGSIAAGQLARAAPDGYALMIILSSHVMNALAYKDLPYDVIADFTPITALATTAYVLTAHPSLPVKSTKDLIALAKAKPGAINFASAGNGSIPHLFQELMNSKVEIQLTHIPYTGGAPALTDLLAGRVHLLMQSVLQCLQYVKADRLRPVAITSAKRSAVLPNVPTLGETIPGYAADQWWALVAPRGLPKPIQARLQSELTRIVNVPATKEFLASQGAEAMGTTSEEAAAIMTAELAKWTPLFKQNIVKPEQR